MAHDNKEAAEIIALARSFGLKGFAKPAEATADAPKGASEGFPDFDASDPDQIKAFARSIGLKGFAECGETHERT